MKKICLIYLFLHAVSFNIWGQTGIGGSFAIEDDDLGATDIFTDFNEDLEATKILEEERFYRYGRYFTFDLSLGLTTHDGNRGKLYENDGPSFGISVHFFKDFHRAFGLGFETSKHHFFVDQTVFGSKDNNIGLVEVSIFRVFLGYRHYIDTSNLGTALTYSNPFFSTRLEYWYLQNKFVDQASLANSSGGGLGLGIGFGLEFPIQVKETYFAVEFLYHTVDYPDKYTQDYREDGKGGSALVDDLTGNTWTSTFSYVMSW